MLFSKVVNAYPILIKLPGKLNKIILTLNVFSKVY